jgi:drug/metabolite transporter (DMT)-like permease
MEKVFLGAICIGLAPIFIKLLNMGPTTIGLYRCGLAALILVPLIWIWVGRGKQPAFNPLRWPANLWKYVALAGVFFAFDLFVYNRSVIYCGAGMGTILGNTQVFYVSALGFLIHKEKMTARFLVAVFLAFIGIYLLVGIEAAPANEALYWDGVFFGFATGVFYTGYILSLKAMEHAKGLIPTEQVFCLVSAISAFCLLLSSIWEGSLVVPQGMQWLWTLGLVVISQIAGWLLITRNLSKVPVSRAGLVLITQPVVATIGGAILFKETLSPIQIAGVILSLAAIYLGSALTPLRLPRRPAGTFRLANKRE